jgi:hypothetical protein
MGMLENVVKISDPVEEECGDKESEQVEKE